MTGEIIAFAETKDGRLKKGALEVVTAAHALAKSLGTQVTAVAITAEAIPELASLGRYGADEIVHADADAFKAYAPGNVARALCELATERQAKAMLLPASALGKDLAPRISAMLKSVQISDCVGLTVEGGEIHLRRPVYAGKARWTVRSKNAITLATLRPNIFTPTESGGADIAVTPWSPKTISDSPRVRLKEVLEGEGGKRIELTEADAIVSGGRGLKGPEHFVILEALADTLGAAVGASRAVVDAGWRPHGDQVGQTGKTVSPNLYIACGISGAIQHLAGMASSRVIVAINKDPEAPIFKLADYGIVGDLFEVVPALTEAIKKAQA